MDFTHTASSPPLHKNQQPRNKKSNRHSGKHLPTHTVAIATPRYDKERTPHWQAGALTVPTQRKDPQVDESADVVDWQRIHQASKTLFNVPASKIKSKVLRKLITFAKSQNTGKDATQLFSSTHVVYAIFHGESNRFYIGETTKDGLVRLRQHWYDRRKKTDTSSLTQYLQRVASKRTCVINELRVVPLRVGLIRDSERKLAESDVICILKRSKFMKLKCLNKTTPLKDTGKRRRHHTPPVDAPAPRNGTTTVQRKDLAPTLNHVLRVPPSNQFDVLSKFSLPKVKRLLLTVDKDAPIARTLREVRRDKYNNKKTSSSNFTVTWASREMSHTNVSSTVRDSTAHWPFEKRYLENTRVTYRLNKHAGGSFRNYIEASLNIESCDITCDCSTRDPKFLYHGHVLTQDAAVFLPEVPDTHRDQIRHLVEIHGPKHRFSLPNLKSLDLVREAATNFVVTYAKKNKMKSEDALATASDWIDFVVSNVTFSPDGVNHYAIPIKKLMSQVHAKFVLAPTDKAAQNTTIWCKKLYYNTFTNHLQSDTFAECDEPIDDVIKRHDGIATTFGKKGHPVLPYMYLLVKFHKLEGRSEALPPVRPIVGKSVKNTGTDQPYNRAGLNSLSEVNIQVAAMLNSVLDLLLLDDQANLIKRCWYTRTVEEFVDIIGRESDLKYISTADFKDMYTKLPQDVLLKHLEKATQLAARVLARQFHMAQGEYGICFTPEGTWQKIPAELQKRNQWSLKKLNQILAELIDNSYVLIGKRLFKQVIGVGMGHEPCPAIANLFLHICERKWVNEMVAKYGEDEVHRRWNNFRGFCRQMDDIFFPMDNDQSLMDPLPTRHDYEGLEFNFIHEGTYAEFIGLEIRLLPVNGRNQVMFTSIDKDKKYKFQLIRYPAFSSTMPKVMITGTIVGMLVRCLTLTTLTEDFMTMAAKTLNYMITHRFYDLHTVKSAIFKFAKRHLSNLYGGDIVQTLLAKATSTPHDVTAQPSDTEVHTSWYNLRQKEAPARPKPADIVRRQTLKQRRDAVVTRSVSAQAAQRPQSLQTALDTPVPRATTQVTPPTPVVSVPTTVEPAITTVAVDPVETHARGPAILDSQLQPAAAAAAAASAPAPQPDMADILKTVTSANEKTIDKVLSSISNIIQQSTTTQKSNTDSDKTQQVMNALVETVTRLAERPAPQPQLIVAPQQPDSSQQMIRLIIDHWKQAEAQRQEAFMRALQQQQHQHEQLLDAQRGMLHDHYQIEANKTTSEVRLLTERDAQQQATMGKLIELVHSTQHLLLESARETHAHNDGQMNLLAQEFSATRTALLQGNAERDTLFTQLLQEWLHNNPEALAIREMLQQLHANQQASAAAFCAQAQEHSGQLAAISDRMDSRMQMLEGRPQPLAITDRPANQELIQAVAGCFEHLTTTSLAITQQLANQQGELMRSFSDGMRAVTAIPELLSAERQQMRTLTQIDYIHLQQQINIAANGTHTTTSRETRQIAAPAQQLQLEGKPHPTAIADRPHTANKYGLPPPSTPDAAAAPLTIEEAPPDKRCRDEASNPRSSDSLRKL